MNRVVLLVAVAATLVVAACGASTGAGGGTGNSVTIVMTEMRFTPNRIDATVGQTISVRIVNQGAQRHDLAFPALHMPNLEGIETNLEPGESTTISLRFDEAGTHTFICTLPGHMTAGMSGAVFVTR